MNDHPGASTPIVELPTAPVDGVACVRGDAALARAFAFLGKRWNAVLLGALGSGPAGFRELAREVTGISDSVLSDRLGDLATAGLIVRTVTEGPRTCGSAAPTTTTRPAPARWAR